MSKAYEAMAGTIEKAKEEIINAIMNYVLAVGEDYDDYHRNEFGIEEEDGEVLKVLDFFNNGGCCFPWTERCDVSDDCGFHYYAFHCLYVVEEDGEKYLKYYMLYNDGTKFDEEESEPDHGYANCLPLQILDKFAAFIDGYDRCLK